jgi:hypothetical protein
MNPHPTRTIQGGVGVADPGTPSGSRHRFDKTRDPGIELMLTAHVHCGEEMALIVPDDPRETDTDAPAAAGQARRNGPRVYRCFCGFSFDQAKE